MSASQFDIALRAALAAPQATLIRCRGGFCIPGTAAPIVTIRTANRLRNGLLASYDHPQIPTRVTLTEAGRDAAMQLVAEAASRRGSPWARGPHCDTPAAHKSYIRYKAIGNRAVSA